MYADDTHIERPQVRQEIQRPKPLGDPVSPALLSAGEWASLWAKRLQFNLSFCVIIFVLRQEMRTLMVQ